MNTYLDGVLVGLVIAAGFGYTLYALGPKTLRGRILLALAAALRRSPTMLGLRGLAERVGTKAANAAGSCGGCDNCGSDETARLPAAAELRPESVLTQGGGAVRAAGSKEVRIPLAAIGKRSQ